MERQRRKKLVTAVTFLFAVCFALIVFYMYSIFLIKQEERLMTENYLIDISQQSRDRVQRQIDSDFQTLRSVAIVLGMYEDLPQPDLQDLLIEENNNNAFTQMGFVDTNGIGIMVTLQEEDAIPIDLSQKEYIQSALAGNETVKRVFTNEEKGNPVAEYAIPVYQNGEITGAVIGVISMETWSAMVDISVLNNDGVAYLIDAKGNVIVYPSKGNANAQITSVSQLQFEGMDEEKLYMALKANESGFLPVSFEERTFWMGYAPLDLNGWYILTFIPEGAINANFNKVVNLAVITIVSFVAVTIMFAIYYFLQLQKNYSQIEQMAYYDVVTGVYNKPKFFEESKYLLKTARQGYATVVFNIDKFKAINETFGYGKGDLILKNIARALEKELLPGEICCRDSADNFGAMLHFENKESLEERLLFIMSKMDSGIFPDGEEYTFSLCCGVNIWEPGDAQEEMTVFTDGALIAMHEIKGEFTNRVAFFDEEMQEEYRRRNEIERYMQDALTEGEFYVEYQPKINIETEEVMGAEALVRWNSKELGPLRPDQFIPIFERNGFIGRVDMYVLRQVCKLLHDRRERGLQLFPIAVNQSRMVFYDENYIDKLLAILTEFTIPTHYIVLEITESMAVEDLGHMHSIINNLQKIGFRVSMDDFGSGYSSLNVLQKIAINELKLDRTFLNSEENSALSRSILEKIVQIAKEFAIETVAEGVETETQLAFLKEIQCDVAQGYFFAKPMPVTAFEEYVEKQNNKG